MTYNIPTADNTSDIPGRISPKNLGIGEDIFSASPGDDLQLIVDAMNDVGGGTLSLSAGTFTMANDLVIPSNVKIQGVGSNASIIDFNNTGYQIKIIGTSMAHLNSVFFNGFSVYNSTSDLIKAQYLDTFEVYDVQCYNGASGFNIDTVTINTIENVVVAASGAGIIGSNISNFSYRNLVISTLLSGHGVSFNAVTQGVIIVLHVDTAAEDGVNFVDCDGITLNMYTISGCGGNGITFDTVASSIALDNGSVTGNGGDGISLTDTNNIQVITNVCLNNTGYAINVTNSGCINTQIIGNIFTGNTAGPINDSGTTTQVRSNIGVSDN